LAEISEPVQDKSVQTTGGYWIVMFWKKVRITLKKLRKGWQIMNSWSGFKNERKIVPLTIILMKKRNSGL